MAEENLTEEEVKKIKEDFFEILHYTKIRESFYIYTALDFVLEEEQISEEVRAKVIQAVKKTVELNQENLEKLFEEMVEKNNYNG